MIHGNFAIFSKMMKYILKCFFFFSFHRHRTIRMKPNEVDSHNEQHLRNTVYNYHRLEPTRNASSVAAIARKNHRPLQLKRRRAEFKVGDHVRLSKYRTVFEKGYTPNWTTEIFRIKKVQYNTDPITYILEDYKNNKIEGSVYAEELQKAKHPDVYLVEKIIRKRNGQIFVKWLGFGPEHNSWIPEDEII